VDVAELVSMALRFASVSARAYAEPIGSAVGGAVAAADLQLGFRGAEVGLAPLLVNGTWVSWTKRRISVSCACMRCSRFRVFDCFRPSTRQAAMATGWLCYRSLQLEPPQSVAKGPGDTTLAVAQV